MGDLAKRLVDIAQGEVGVREEGPNTGSRVIIYQMSTSLSPGPWPWCAAFVSWCVREWVMRMTDAERTRIGALDGPIGWRCNSANVYDWEKWAVNRRLKLFEEDQPMQPGDIVTFDFGHIGIVKEDHGPQFVSIEGNTNDQGSREGDGVYVRRRARSLIRKIIRITDL